ASNLIWDTGSGCVWDGGGGTPPPVIEHNTCYDFGKGAASGNPTPEGVSGHRRGGTAVIRNNIIYAPNGSRPLDWSRFTASTNLCAYSLFSTVMNALGFGDPCGSNSRSWSSVTVLSTDPASPFFLRIGPDSEARNHGTLDAEVERSYFGASRPLETLSDI